MWLLLFFCCTRLPYLTFRERRLLPSAEASNGPTVHPRINRNVTKSSNVEFSWVYTSNGTIPLSKWNTHWGSFTVTHSRYLRENIDFKSTSTIVTMTWKSKTSKIDNGLLIWSNIRSGQVRSRKNISGLVYAEFFIYRTTLLSNNLIEAVNDQWYFTCKWKKALGETQTLRTGHSNAEPKNFTPPQTPFPGAQDCQNLISWRWSLPAPTDPVWWRSMHAILSYRGNRQRPPIANMPTDRNDNNTLHHSA